MEYEQLEPSPTGRQTDGWLATLTGTGSGNNTHVSADVGGDLLNPAALDSLDRGDLLNPAASDVRDRGDFLNPAAPDARHKGDFV